MSSVERRDFLKTAAAGGLGLVAAGSVARVSGRPAGTVNPAIDDTLVVNVTDSSMVTGAYSTNPSTQFSRIDGVRVRANMDELAKALTSRTTASEAWATIFRKPATKQWSAVTVAIKVNCINSAMYVKPQIIGKVCEELIRLGVQASNICLFDGGNATNQATAYSAYVGTHIPAGVVTLNKSSSQQVRNTRDIMVNCAINKGHSNGNAGNVTLCMKNHVGTYKFSCPSSYDEMVGWSQTAMSGTPPMQQLCIIDSLFAACTGPNDIKSHQPNCISMGTHPAVVDAMVTRYIRSGIMGCDENTEAMDYFLNAFSIDRADCQWQSVPPASTAVATPSGPDGRTPETVHIRLSAGNHLEVAVHRAGAHTCTVTSNDGRVVMSASGAGKMTYRLPKGLAPGAYVVQVRNGNRSIHQEVLRVAR